MPTPTTWSCSEPGYPGEWGGDLSRIIENDIIPIAFNKFTISNRNFRILRKRNSLSLTVKTKPNQSQPKTIQGWTKITFPGSVNMSKKNCALPPAAGRRTQFSTTYSQNLGRLF